MCSPCGIPPLPFVNECLRYCSDKVKNIEALTNETEKLERTYPALGNKLISLWNEVVALDRNEFKVNPSLETWLVDVPLAVDRAIRAVNASKKPGSRNNPVSAYKIGQEIKNSQAEIDYYYGFTFESKYERIPFVTPAGSISIWSLDGTFPDDLSAFLTENRVVGIVGYRGSGKTSLLRHIAQQWREHYEGRYHVISIDGKELSTVEIKKKLIAERGGSALEIKAQMIKGVDFQISQEDLEMKYDEHMLKLYGNRFFAILIDNLSQEVDLHKLGLPQPTESNRCRLIFSCTDPLVARSSYVKKTYWIESLKLGDGIQLFNKVYGGQSFLYEEFITELVGLCLGLPKAIISVAKIMKYMETYMNWKDVTQLFKDTFVQVEQGSIGESEQRKERMMKIEQVIDKIRFDQINVKADVNEGGTMIDSTSQDNDDLSINQKLNGFRLTLNQINTKLDGLSTLKQINTKLEGLRVAVEGLGGL